MKMCEVRFRTITVDDSKDNDEDVRISVPHGICRFHVMGVRKWNIHFGVEYWVNDILENVRY